MIELAEYIVSTFIVGTVAFVLIRVIAAAFDHGDGPYVKPKVEEDLYLKTHLGARLFYYAVLAAIATGALAAIAVMFHVWSRFLTGH